MPDVELKAGRELDALIAEKVMGWQEITKSAAQLEVGQFYNRQDGIIIVEYRNRLREFAPSTSIADAWLVVEKLVKERHPCPIENKGEGLGFRLEINAESGWSTDQCNVWTAVFPSTTPCPPHEEMHDDYKAEADTAPLAICLAALKAVGH
jgi:hypothetical protein